MKEGMIGQLRNIRQYFLNTTKCFVEGDSAYAPTEEMYTVAQMIGHTAQTVEWFIDGAFGLDGFDMNFDNYAEKMKQYTSLEKSLQYFEQAIEQAIQTIDKASDEELAAPIPEGQVMGGAPKMAVVGALADHTAHHRGSLAVYARLLGKTPADAIWG